MAGGPQRTAAGDPEAIGGVLTRLRLARGYSQLRLAERLCAAAGMPTVSRHEVSRWEREERLPGPFWLGWLAVVLDAPLDQLEVAVATARQQPAAGRAGSAEHRRLWRPPTADELLAGLDSAGGHDLRELAHAWLAGPPEPEPAGQAAAAPTPAAAVTEATGPAAASRLSPAVIGWSSAAGRLSPAGPGGSSAAGRQLASDPADALDRLAARLAELRRMDDLVGGADLAGLVHRELRAAIAVLRAAGAGSARRRALRLVAQFGQLAGWVHADAGDPAAARRAYRAALRAAAAAADRPLAAHVLGGLSHQLLADGNPQEALLLARTARTGGTGASGRTQALLLHRLALAAARCGERRAAHAALAAADRVADRSRPEQEPPWLYWLDSPELTAMTGRCLAVLGRPLRAAQRLAVPRRGIGPRAAAIYLTWLARCYLELGEVELACRMAMRGLRQAVRAGSARAATGLRHLHPLLLRHRDVPTVRGYERLVTAVADYLPAPVQPPPGAGRSIRSGAGRAGAGHPGSRSRGSVAG